MRLNSIKIIILTICIIISSFTAITYADVTFSQSELDNIFKQANLSYEQQQFYTAIEHYNELINKGIKNGDLYFNLANAYFKNGQIGNSILNYKNALVFKPRDADVKANMKFALEQTSDQLSTDESVEPILSILLFWYYDLNLPELLSLTIFVNAIVCICLICSIFYKNEILRISNYIVLIILAILIISSVTKLINNYRITEGVVIVTEAEAKSANGECFQTLFKLHEGTTVKISDHKEDWYKVVLSDGKKGWLYKDSLGLVNASM